jgi:uncharacterized protein YcsI (UPF0317 family)
MADLERMTPKEYRNIVRKGEWTDQSLGVCKGYSRMGFVILPKDYAYDFLVFRQRNPLSCPLVDISEEGSPYCSVAPDADLRTDLPRYSVYKDGKIIDEPMDIKKYWRNDLVCFLMGCAETFDWALKAANLHYRFLGSYPSNIPLIPAGPFRGVNVCSCRVFKNAQEAIRGIQISSRFPIMHGTPVHIGDPTVIGIDDLTTTSAYMAATPEEATIRPGEIAVFFHAGTGAVRQIALESKLPFMIASYPLAMFIADQYYEEFSA